MSSSWSRFAKIVVTFAVLGPLVGATVLFLYGVVVVRPPLAQWPALWLNWVVNAGMVAGTLCALAVGVLFAAAAVFFGRSQLWVALVAAFLVLMAVQVPAGAPIWQWSLPIAIAGLLGAMIPTALAWRVTRRWHRIPGSLR